MRLLWYSFGGLFVALGFVGLLLPIMPTVPFLIMAAFCFARSSEKMHRWLLSHALFGPPLADWQANGAIRRKTKWIAIMSMAIGYSAVIVLGLPFWLLAVQGSVLTAVAIFIWRRPEPRTSEPGRDRRAVRETRTGS